VMAAEVGRPEAYRTLADAIADGDPDAAKNAAMNLLEPATTAMLAVITSLEEKP
jgi:GntR family transcriptional regulator, transcriptional repressor for pyruvate dehydrogenase complex